MSIHVTDFKWEKGKNDLQYIELLEKTLKNEQAITAKAVAKIRELSKENKESRNKVIDEVIMQLEAEVESSAKFIREYDDSIAQKAYYKGLSNALKIAEEMKK